MKRGDWRLLPAAGWTGRNIEFFPPVRPLSPGRTIRVVSLPRTRTPVDHLPHVGRHLFVNACDSLLVAGNLGRQRDLSPRAGRFSFLRRHEPGSHATQYLAETFETSVLLACRHAQTDRSIDVREVGPAFQGQGNVQ